MLQTVKKNIVKTGECSFGLPFEMSEQNRRCIPRSSIIGISELHSLFALEYSEAMRRGQSNWSKVTNFLDMRTIQFHIALINSVLEFTRKQ